MHLVRLVPLRVLATSVLLPAGLGIMLALAASASAQKPKIRRLLTPAKAAKTPVTTTRHTAAQSHAQRLALAKLMQAALGAIKGNQAAVLKYSYVLLASASSDYNGHKTRALHELHVALGILGAPGTSGLQQHIDALRARDVVLAKNLARGLGVNVSQNLSDAQLAHARHLLIRLSLSLVENGQINVDVPVKRAIHEINEALRFAAGNALKGQEANLLTQAYVLLSAANHDYVGHRGRAKRHLEEALNVLDARILVGGPVAEKIKVARERTIATLAALKEEEDATLHEPQVVSDVQMLMADVRIRQVWLLMEGAPNVGLIRVHLRDADREIRLGMIVN